MQSIALAYLKRCFTKIKEFVSTIRKKNKCYEHTAFSYKHIPICYNEIGSELLVKGCPSPANTDEQGKVKG